MKKRRKRRKTKRKKRKTAWGAAAYRRLIGFMSAPGVAVEWLSVCKRLTDGWGSRSALRILLEQEEDQGTLEELMRQHSRK